MVVPSPDDVYWVWRDTGSSSSDCSPLWGWRLQQLRRVKYHSESGEFVVEAGRYCKDILFTHTQHVIA